MQNVLFNVLMAKTIPQNMRGRLLGLRFFLGGLTASCVAWIGGRFLVEGNVLGNGYAATFLLAFALTALGLSLLMLVREPESREVRAASSTRARLKEIPGMLRTDRNFASYFAVQAIATIGFFATPFYVLGAGAKLGLTGTLLGDLSFLLLISQTFAHLGWGWLGDSFGFRIVLFVGLASWAAGALVLAVAGSFWGVAGAFVLLGLGLAGFQLGTQNLVFDFPGQTDLPMRLALVNSSQSLIQGFGALAGGQLVSLAGYEAVFIAAALVKLAAAVLLLLRVREPRNAARGAR
jgi:MFS family permease